MKLKNLLGSANGDNTKFEDWQRQNPSKPFKDFFAQAVVSKLTKGRPHASLGGKLHRGFFGHSGRHMLKTLREHGLKQEDTCVDYGCGTLRLGIHAIKYLQRGAYWGMEISPFLLEEGRKLIGESLWTEKQPNLRVISADSVAEVAATKPAMLFSVKVLIHIHPDELSEYFQNIMKIIGFSGQAIVTGKWSEHDTVQISTLSWAHGTSIIKDIVKAQGGCMEIIREAECQLESLGQAAKSGMFLITNDSDTAQH